MELCEQLTWSHKERPTHVETRVTDSPGTAQKRKSRHQATQPFWWPWKPWDVAPAHWTRTSRSQIALDCLPCACVQQQLQPSLLVGTETGNNHWVKSFGPSSRRWKHAYWVMQIRSTVCTQPAQLFAAGTQPAFHQRASPAGLSQEKRSESGTEQSIGFFSPLPLFLVAQHPISPGHRLCHTLLWCAKCRPLKEFTRCLSTA